MWVSNYKKGMLLLAIQKFGTVHGKKALHKIIYFANLKSETFSFQWNKYGPYSEELKYTLDDAIMDGIIEVNQMDIPNYGYQLNMKLSKDGSDSAKPLLNSKLNEPINFAYNVLKEKNPREMEILASVHYIINHNNMEYNLDFVYDTLMSLKPTSGFTKENVIQSINELRGFRLAN